MFTILCETIRDILLRHSNEIKYMTISTGIYALIRGIYGT